MRDFDVPDSVLVAHATSARMIAPSARQVDMPIEGGFVGMVDRETFDEWLRERAARAGAERRTGLFERIERDADDVAVVCYRQRDAVDGEDVIRGANSQRDRRRWRTLPAGAPEHQGRQERALRLRLS